MVFSFKKKWGKGERNVKILGRKVYQKSRKHSWRRSCLQAIFFLEVRLMPNLLLLLFLLLLLLLLLLLTHAEPPRGQHHPSFLCAISISHEIEMDEQELSPPPEKFPFSNKVHLPRKSGKLIPSPSSSSPKFERSWRIFFFVKSLDRRLQTEKRQNIHHRLLDTRPSRQADFVSLKSGKRKASPRLESKMKNHF